MAKKRVPPVSAPADEPTWAWARLAILPPLLLLVFHRFWNHSIIYRDSLQYFAPQKFLIAQALRSGTVQAWYPWQLLGIPFVADIQSGWFYPLNVLYLLFPFELAHRLFVLVHYPMAAVFMGIFLKGRGLGRVPTLLGSLAFSLSGYLISQHASVTMLVGACWAPLALHCADRAARGFLRSAVATGAVLAMQILGGDPQAATITAILVLIRGVVAATKSNRRWRPLFAVGVAGAAVLVLAAAQILPTFEMLMLSVRGSGLDPTESALFSFHPGRVIELIWATPFGGVWPAYTFWGTFALDPSNAPPWSITNYVGLPVMTLAFLGIGWSRRRWRLFVGAGAVLFFLLALGRHGPLFGVFHGAIPLLGPFRYPEKYMAWFAGCVAVGAALGLERLLEWLPEKAASVARASRLFMAGTGIAAVLALLAWPSIVTNVTRQPPGSLVQTLAIGHLWVGGVQFLAVNLLAALIVLAIAKRRVSLDLGFALLLLALTVDWTLANVSTMSLGPTNYYDSRPAAARILEPRGRPELGQFRIFREAMEFRDLDASLSPLPPVRRRIWERATLLRNLDAMEGFEDVVGYNAGLIAQGLPLLRSNLSPAVLERFNVRYILSSYGRPPLGGIRSEVVYADRGLDLTVTRLLDAQPRAYFTSSARYARTDPEALALLRSPAARESVILPADGSHDAAAREGGGILPVTIASYEPDRVELEVESDRAGWVVLSDRHYPGWEATVDGAPAGVLRANVVVRAVAVPAGRHTIVFAFRPMPLRIGLVLSILGWSALLVGWIATLLRGPRSPARVLPEAAASPA
jgi:hypothetical protein